MMEKYRTVSVRLTEEEYEQLCQKAKTAGYRQAAPFVKSCIFQSTLVCRSLEGSEEVSEKMDELISLVREKLFVSEHPAT
jgi:hypothetical protein